MYTDRAGLVVTATPVCDYGTGMGRLIIDVKLTTALDAGSEVARLLLLTECVGCIFFFTRT